MSPKAKTARQIAFEEEALPHLDFLHNFARRMTNSAEDAADLVQETYFRAFRFWDRYERGTNIRAWLFRILRNIYINRFRRESREPDPLDFASAQKVENRAGESTDLDPRESLNHLLEDEVAEALAELPDQFRTVVLLCDIEGLTYEEISEFIEVPVGTVRSRLHRGRKQLRLRLIDYARDRGFAKED